MINKIRIENVKGYDVQGKDLNVNLDPTKINLCVAPNGFGKSSLATAFESLKKSRLEISEDNKHVGQKNEPSSLKLTIDGVEYTANDSKNEFADYQAYVIHNRSRVDYKKQRIITCHIGNGGSLAAVKDGKCMDTSMGLTPLEGIMMGTRSGDVDGGAVAFLQKKLCLDADGISNLLNKKSGVAGISGVGSDMRDLENACKQGNKRAILAQEMYNYKIKKYIGAYAAAMGGVDIIVFTAGVGENQTSMRSEACKGLEFMGVKIDEAKNATIRGKEAIISAPDSKVTVVVIPTDEELMIASDTMALVSK
jgi:acetate kinase